MLATPLEHRQRPHPGIFGVGLSQQAGWALAHHSRNQTAAFTEIPTYSDHASQHDVAIVTAVGQGPTLQLGELNAMKAARIALEKIFWLVVAGIPLMPPYVLYEFHSALACSDNGICFRYGSPFLNRDGLIIVYLSIALLWPMCIWELIGKHIFFRRLRQRLSTKLRANRFATFFGRLYWLMVGVIPLLYWYLFGTSYSPSDCDGNGSCIDFYLPLDTVSKVAVLISCCLLWPVCVRKLVSRAGFNPPSTER